jgi:uracil-DNA glycosylase
VNPKIAIVGDAWGEEEERQRIPFVGVAGYALNKMLEDAGIRRADCFLTNCFNLRPPGGNDIDNLCGPKSEAIPGRPAVKSGKYISARYASELARLESELRELRPNLTIALGGTASWALLGDGRISRIRGAIAPSPFGKVLATYHPAAVLREWSLRPITVLDLRKAAKQSEFPEIRRPQRAVYIYPELSDLEVWHAHLAEAEIISFDIETAGDQITCIGFSPDVRTAYVVPFVDPRRDGASYWSSPMAEREAWKFVSRVLATPARKVTQNGLYDVHFLWRRYGISINNWTEDTMLLHHALMIESQKGLDFLGSIYTDEASWKLMRAKGKGTIKRDE